MTKLSKAKEIEHVTDRMLAVIEDVRERKDRSYFWGICAIRDLLFYFEQSKRPLSKNEFHSVTGYCIDYVQFLRERKFAKAKNEAVILKKYCKWLGAGHKGFSPYYTAEEKALVELAD